MLEHLEEHGAQKGFPLLSKLFFREKADVSLFKRFYFILSNVVKSF